ncbi:MAG: Gfo/Idh/MocA family oxidoreductase [Lactobacillaceae bacterium]|jgi:predicted dehydrogenase|nr:Gfo/Idh/MocA family oxidoreductase [Lactobacillaceae bacterium]
MIKIGLVGTSWITKQLAEAFIESGEYEIMGIYSRGQTSAQKMIDELKIKAEIFNDYQSMLKVIDAVYIASPNSLHFQQIKTAIENKIDVIVEKPSVSNTQEFASVLKLLEENPDVRLFEAIRNIYDPNFQIVNNTIAELPAIQGANLIYAKYSSKYDTFLKHEPNNTPNVFSLNFSGGVLYDMGVYVVYAAVGWFGYPEKISYIPQLLDNGIDGSGIINFEYPNFQINMFISKIVNSYQKSEIYGLKETISIDSVAELDNIQLIDENKKIKKQLNVPHPQNPTLNEVKYFAEILKDRYSPQNLEKYEKALMLAANINQLMFDLRKNAGIRFQADEKNI